MTSKKKTRRPWHLEIVEGRPSFWSQTTLWHVNIVGANGEIVYTRETGDESSAVVCAKRTTEETGLKLKAATP